MGNDLETRMLALERENRRWKVLGLLLFLAAGLASTISAESSSDVVRARSVVRAGQSPGQTAADECRTLLSIDLFNEAIARCEEAVRLDPKPPDPYLMLGTAYDRLWQQENRTSSAPNAARLREQRRKAAEHYRKFLALTPGDTEARLTARAQALSGLLALHVMAYAESPGTAKHDVTLAQANELAQSPALAKRDMMVLAAIYSQHRRLDLSAAFLTRDLKADPADSLTCKYLASLYADPDWTDGPRFGDRIDSLELCAAQTPDDFRGHLRVATSLWEKAYRDKTLTDPQKLTYVERGLGHVDRALALDNDLVEALVYKGLLLRTKALAVPDPAVQKRLIAEAVALQDRAKAVKARTGTAPSVSAPPPPPPPPPVRVEGQITEPRKITGVSPVYPPIAQSARVQGVVTLECTIGPDGRVTDATVLRGIPLLDQAAIDAVKQWVYTPTFLEGVPVSVIMTVAVTFKLN